VRPSFPPSRQGSPPVSAGSKGQAASAHARRSHGGGRGLAPGTVPLTGVRSAKTAIRNRGAFADTSAVLDKVARSPYSKNPQVAQMLANARRRG
jgi:hypothetical protein